MSQWPTDYRTWKGTLPELVKTANAVLANKVPDSIPVSVRTARHYQDKGLIGRGDKQGRSAHYGFTDLEALVASKELVSGGLPIDYASSLMANTPMEAITTALAPSGQSASAVVANMMRSAHLAPLVSHQAVPHAFNAPVMSLSSATRSVAPPLHSPMNLSPVAWLQLHVDEAALRVASATERTQAAHTLLHLASRLTAPPQE